jgi:magnesium transporter
VYSGGRRIRDIAIEEAGEWSQRPGHVVWIGLFEPSTDLLRRVQAQLRLHYLAIEDAGKAHQHPKIEQYGEALFVVARTAQSIDGQIALRGDTPVRGARICGVDPPRRFDLLRRRARAL